MSNDPHHVVSEAIRGFGHGIEHPAKLTDHIVDALVEAGIVPHRHPPRPHDHLSGWDYADAPVGTVILETMAPAELIKVDVNGKEYWVNKSNGDEVNSCSLDDGMNRPVVKWGGVDD